MKGALGAQIQGESKDADLVWAFGIVGANTDYDALIGAEVYRIAS